MLPEVSTTRFTSYGLDYDFMSSDLDAIRGKILYTLDVGSELHILLSSKIDELQQLLNAWVLTRGSSLSEVREIHKKYNDLVYHMSEHSDIFGKIRVDFT